MAGADIVKRDSDSGPVPHVERLAPTESALIRLEYTLDAFSENVGSAIENSKRSVIRATVIMNVLIGAAIVVLYYFF